MGKHNLKINKKDLDEAYTVWGIDEEIEWVMIDDLIKVLENSNEFTNQLITKAINFYGVDKQGKLYMEPLKFTKKYNLDYNKLAQDFDFKNPVELANMVSLTASRETICKIADDFDMEEQPFFCKSKRK